MSACRTYNEVDPLGALLGLLETPLGPSGVALGPSWGPLESSWGVLGASLAPLGTFATSCPILGSSWEPLDLSWEPPGNLLRASWAPLGRLLGTKMEPQIASESHLGLCCPYFALFFTPGEHKTSQNLSQDLPKCSQNRWKIDVRKLINFRCDL